MEIVNEHIKYIKHIKYKDKKRQNFLKRLILCSYMASELPSYHAEKLLLKSKQILGEIKTNRQYHSNDYHIERQLGLLNRKICQ